MARSIGNTIPASIRPLFDGTELEQRIGLTFLLLSVTEQGWPHLAMLSVGEVLAVSERQLRLALWLNSTAARNLARDQRATLALVANAAGYSLRCRATPGPTLTLPLGGRVASFALTVEDVLEDVAPYAVLTGGVTFSLKDPAEVVPRWRETVEALRAVAIP